MGNPYINTPQLASGYLNNENNAVVGKQQTGSPVNLPAQAYGGMLGKLFVCDDAEAARLSLTSVGTLRAGIYMCVKVKAGATPVRGAPCAWDTSANSGLTNYTVVDYNAATQSIAGIYLNVPTAGNQTWIQVAGLATLLCRAAVTTTTIGTLAVLTALGTATFDSIADATDYFTTAGALKTVVGQWYEAPANSGLKLAWINGFGVRRFVS